MPNKCQHQVACELQGRRIEAPGLPALVLPVNTRRWVLVDNTVSFKMMLGKPTLLKQSPLSVYVTSTTLTRSTKVSMSVYVIEAPSLPALVLPVNVRRWVLVDNTVSFKMMLGKPTLLKQSPLSVYVTSTTPTRSMKVSMSFQDDIIKTDTI
jgi:predicted transcriptional regulator of viral defense system